ncbi:MAG: glycosyltransferase [Pseudomonadota bacterium]
MKILEVCEFYSERGGGVRTYVEQKFAAAAACGVTLVVVAPGVEDRTEERPNGGKVIWVASPHVPVDKRYCLFSDRKQIDDIVAAERPDFIEASSPWRGAWFAGRQAAEIPKALVLHQDPVSTYPQTVLRHLLSYEQIDFSFGWFFSYLKRLQSLFDVSVAPSTWLSDRLQSKGLIRPEVCAFGVDRSVFAKAERSEFMRRRLLRQCGIDDPSAKLLVTISRYHPEKRLPLMFSAFEKASATQKMGLIVFGDGPDRKNVEKHAAKTPHIHLAGFLNDRQQLAGMLASADAYIHAMPNETYGMAVAEALCAGAPVIAPRAGGILDFVNDQCAELFERDDVDDFANAIRRLFTRDTEKLRAAATTQATSIRNHQNHFFELFSLYSRLAGKPAPALPEPMSVQDVDSVGDIFSPAKAAPIAKAVRIP